MLKIICVHLGIAVENLNTLMADMENFKNKPTENKDTSAARTIKIEIEKDDIMAKKVDCLTDQLKDAFDSPIQDSAGQSKESLGITSTLFLLEEISMKISFQEHV